MNNGGLTMTKILLLLPIILPCVMQVYAADKPEQVKKIVKIGHWHIIKELIDKRDSPCPQIMPEIEGSKKSNSDDTKVKKHEIDWDFLEAFEFLNSNASIRELQEELDARIERNRKKSSM